jgi:hypothetical protein
MQKVRWIVALGIVTWLASLFTIAAEPRVQIINVETGCTQHVYVDGHKLVRYEKMLLGPGTGYYGEWMEDYLEPVDARVYSYSSQTWPRQISDDEVRKLLGVTWYKYFNQHRRVTVSEVFNMTGLRYPGVKLYKHREC